MWKQLKDRSIVISKKSYFWVVIAFLLPWLFLLEFFGENNGDLLGNDNLNLYD